MRIYSKDYQRGIEVRHLDSQAIKDLVSSCFGTLAMDTGVGPRMCSDEVTPVTLQGAQQWIAHELKA